MHEVASVDLRDLTQPTELFTHTNKVDPMDIVNNEANSAGKTRDNGASPPRGTQPYYPHSSQTEYSVAL